MSFEIVGMIFQATATVATILTIFYLANQIRLNNKLAVSSIEHHLNTRVYERRFVTARDNDFCDLIIHSVAICGQFPHLVLCGLVFGGSGYAAIQRNFLYHYKPL